MGRSLAWLPRLVQVLGCLVLAGSGWDLLAQELPGDESPRRRAVIVNVRTTAGSIPPDTRLLERVIEVAGSDRVTETFKTDAFVAELSPNEIATLEQHSHVFRVEEIRTFSPLAARTESVYAFGAEPVWELEIDGIPLDASGKSIVIMDSGINFEHPDLDNELDANLNCFEGPCEEDDEVGDRSGHGTSVASVAAANGNLLGVAFGLNIISARVFPDTGDATSLSMRRALDWAIDHQETYDIAVVSMSIGDGCGAEEACDDDNTLLATGIDLAFDQNLPVIVATGNSFSETEVCIPACVENAIAISGTDDDARAPFANYNPLSPLFAPSVAIEVASYDPDVDDQGFEYRRANGTSFAAPAAAAAVAILIQAHEQLGITDWTPTSLESLLFETGETIQDLDASLYRRIHLESAVRSLLPRPVEDPICFALPHETYLSWFNEGEYDEIELFRDGESIAILDGGEDSFVDDDAPGGLHAYEVVAIRSSAASVATECSVFVPEELNFDFEGPTPRTASPIGESFRVTIEGTAGHELGSNTPTLLYDLGEGFVEVSLTDLGDDLFEGEFPPVDCGERVSWYLRAETSTGLLGHFPSGAPENFQVVVGSDAREVILNDDMEISRGWSVGGPDDDAARGVWERGDPIGTVAQPEDDHTEEGSLCFFTSNGLGTVQVNHNDIDGGRTTLTSPVLDLGGLEGGAIEYWRWYDNERWYFVDDVLLVELTDDGETWVEVESIGPEGPGTTGGWIRHEIEIDDFVDHTSTVQIRFIASDEVADSTVEAAVDDVRVVAYSCSSVPVLRVSDSSTTPGSEVQLAVTLDTTVGGEVSAISFGVETPADLELAQLQLGDALGGADDTALTEVDGGFTLEATWVAALEPGMHELVVVSYTANTSIGDTREVCFSEALGDPPVPIVVDLFDGPSMVERLCGTISTVDTALFIRGDVDGDGTAFPILDALALLEYGFAGAEEPPCLDAADTDADNAVFPILDALYLLDWGFSGGVAPSAPSPPDCGTDPDDDLLVVCETPTENCP